MAQINLKQIKGLNAGSILFLDNQKVTENNSNLFWDNQNNRLGIGTTSPTEKLDVVGSINVSDRYKIENDTVLRYNSVQESIYVGLNSGYESNGDTYRTVGVGVGSLQNNIGDYVSAFGYNSLQNNTADFSTGFGYSSLRNNTQINNAGFGSYTLTNNTGSNCTGIGIRALENNTGSESTGIGVSALRQNSGGQTIAIGNSAGNNNSGYRSILIGVGTGVNNTGIYAYSQGHFASYNNSGSYTIALGHFALRDNSGNNSIGIGYNTLRNNSNVNNTSIGHLSGYNDFSLSGIDNTFIGFNSVYATSSISNSTAIGANTTLTDSNTVILGNNANVGIGTTSPTEKLDVVGRIKSNEIKVDSANRYLGFVDDTLSLLDSNAILVDTTTDSNSDGLADDFLIAIGGTASLVTGNGHIGTAQRLEYESGLNNGLRYNTQPPIIGKELTISFMYRSNIDFDITNGFSNVGYPTVTSNTGSASRYEETAVFNPSGGQDSVITFSWVSNPGEYFEISDFSITPVTGLATDNSVNVEFGRLGLGSEYSKVDIGGFDKTETGYTTAIWTNNTDSLRIYNSSKIEILSFSDLGELDIVGNIQATGYITGMKCGAAGYLATPRSITVATASTYYPIGGFTVPVAENFSTGSTYPDGLKYDGTKTQYFAIDFSATVEANVNTTTVKIAVQKNGTNVAMSLMGVFCKNSAQLYNLSGTCVLELSQNDEVQFVLTSDDNGDIITVDYFTAKINEFFD